MGKVPHQSSSSKLFWKFSFFSFGLSLVVLAGSPVFAQRPDVESWVKEATIKGEDITRATNAAKVAGGIALEHTRKWSWANQVEDKKGVLVIHPFSARKPAEIKVKTGNFKSGMKLQIIARGSDTDLE